MKSIQVIGSVVTKKTAAGYLARLATMIYADLDRAGAEVFDREASKIVKAGFLTWEQVEEIEINAIAQPVA